MDQPPDIRTRQMTLDHFLSPVPEQSPPPPPPPRRRQSRLEILARDLMRIDRNVPPAPSGATDNLIVAIASLPSEVFTDACKMHDSKAADWQGVGIRTIFPAFTGRLQRGCEQPTARFRIPYYSPVSSAGISIVGWDYARNEYSDDNPPPMVEYRVKCGSIIYAQVEEEDFDAIRGCFIPTGFLTQESWVVEIVFEFGFTQSHAIPRLLCREWLMTRDTKKSYAKNECCVAFPYNPDHTISVKNGAIVSTVWGI